MNQNTKKRVLYWSLAVLAIYFICTCILPLGIRPMLRPDEFRYAEIPREMLQSGNWTVPYLSGVRYFEKPILGYQLTALSFSIFGENAFALRFPSALAAMLSGLFILLLMNHESKDPYLPGLAAGLWLTMSLPFGTGIFAVPDMPLTCALTFTIGGFRMAYCSKPFSERILWLFLAGAACGAAFLIKGFLALAVPAAAIAPYLIWKHDWKAFLVYPWVPLAAALIVALPWSLQIASLEPDFWRYFFMEEHVQRFLGRTHDRRPQPFWYFLPVLIGGILPAGLVWFSVWKGAGKRFVQSDMVQFLLSWFIFPFLMFSISSCKLPAYILPCFPPVACLTALALRHAMLDNASGFSKKFSVLRQCWGWFWLFLSLAGSLVLIFVPQLSENLFFMTAALVTAFVYGLFVLKIRMKACRILPAVMLGMVPIIMFAIPAIPGRIFKSKAPQFGLVRCMQEIPITKKDIVLVERSGIAAVSWLLKRNDLIVLSHPGELGYGFQNYPEYAGRFDIALTRFSEFKQQASSGNVILIMLTKLSRGAQLTGWPIEKQVTCDGVTVIQFSKGSIQPPPSKTSPR